MQYANSQSGATCTKFSAQVEIRLARATRRTIHLSVLVGTCISVVMLALATGGSVSPVSGAVLHNVGEVYVLLNSARLLRFS